MKNTIHIFSSNVRSDYELLDTGEGEKLERFGKYTFVRPYEDAVWKKTLPENKWKNANGKFNPSLGGSKPGWIIPRTAIDMEKKWVMSHRGVKFWATPTPFRHLGFFPEQASHWDFIEQKITQEVKRAKRPVKFLNLFGYTGVASLFALRAGAEVTHVDASKTSLEWAKENQNLNSFSQTMRIIEDDVMKFLEREEKRGHKYDAVIMDPPKFGRGPKGETWKIEKDLPKLLLRVRKILSDNPLFVILTSYATKSSPLSLGYALGEMMADFKGSVRAGELCMEESANRRLISLANTAIYASSISSKSF